MKKIILLIFLLVGTMSMSVKTYNPNIIADKVWTTFQDASNEIKWNIDSMALETYSITCYYPTKYKTYTHLDMYCNNGITVRIYGNDKIKTLISKLNNGQELFNFPTTVFYDYDGVYIYYKGD